MSETHDVSNANCLNCSTPLTGNYCHECGQRASSLHVSLHDFFHEAMHEFVHLDGKIVRTMKLLVTRPGQLTKEFLEGRRARFISPIRVYLSLSVIFFALVAVVPGAAIIKIKVGGKDVPSAEASSRPDRKPATPNTEADVELAHESDALMHNIPRAMFVLMPIFGLLTWAFYRRQQPYFVPHLYYAVHFHAFVFFVLSVVALLSLAGAAGRVVGSALFLTLFPYHYVALRRVFGGSLRATLAKGTILGIIYWLTLALAMVALTMLTLGIRLGDAGLRGGIAAR